MEKSGIFAFLVGAVLLASAGCGGADRPSLVTVKGKVTLNGKPIEGALIAMKLDPPNPKYARPCQGRTNAAGEFIPSMYGDAEGIPTGKYKIAVVKQEFPENYNTETPELARGMMTYIVPQVYSDPETSGLVVEVKSGKMEPEVIALEGEPQKVPLGPQRRANDP